jgi:hypothetical protein
MAWDDRPHHAPREPDHGPLERLASLGELPKRGRSVGARACFRRPIGCSRTARAPGRDQAMNGFRPRGTKAAAAVALLALLATSALADEARYAPREPGGSTGPPLTESTGEPDAPTGGIVNPGGETLFIPVLLGRPSGFFSVLLGVNWHSRHSLSRIWVVRSASDGKSRLGER